MMKGDDKMKKIFTLIVNNKKELLLLLGSPNDPQYKKSFWYTVTGGYEKEDKNLENTVKREVKEETNLDVTKIIPLNIIFRYKSLGKDCEEYVYVSFVDTDDDIILNEENIDYEWCNIDEFINKIMWDDSKEELKKMVEKTVNME